MAGLNQLAQTTGGPNVAVTDAAPDDLTQLASVGGWIE